MAELSQQALATLAQHNVVPSAYIAHYSGPDEIWSGDTCGCADDRCIGFHHEGADGCHCLEVWIEEFLKTVVPVAVGFNPEYEAWFSSDDPWLADSDPEVHLVNAPLDLWARRQTAVAADTSTLDELVALTGADKDTGLSAKPCPRWDGLDYPGSVWWTAHVPPSGSSDVWPAGDRGVDVGSHHPTFAAAKAWVDALPETIHLLPFLGGEIRAVDRASLMFDNRSVRGGATSCDRCGHARADHANQGEPRELGADV